jgi:hypothetical protein
MRAFRLPASERSRMPPAPSPVAIVEPAPASSDA